MWFQIALLQLFLAYRTSEFDAKSFSNILSKSVELIPDERIRRRYRVKPVSNDLFRLYKMTFLKRQRIKRRVITSKGKSCNRGYCYVYSISKQGLSYLKFLMTTKLQNLAPLSDNEFAKSLIAIRFKNDPSKKEERMLMIDAVFPASPPSPEKPSSENAKFWSRRHDRWKMTADGKKEVKQLYDQAMLAKLRSEYPFMNWLNPVTRPENQEVRNC